MKYRTHAVYYENGLRLLQKALVRMSDARPIPNSVHGVHDAAHRTNKVIGELRVCARLQAGVLFTQLLEEARKLLVRLALNPSLVTELQHVSMQCRVHTIHGVRGPGSRKQMLRILECLCHCVNVYARFRVRYKVLGCLGIQTEGNKADEGTDFRENFGDAPHGKACLLVAFELRQLDVFT